VSKRRRIVGTQREVAKSFRVSGETVRDWRKLGMPGRKGRWDLDEIAAWRDARREAGSSMPAGLAHQYRQAKLAREINAAKREAARAEREQIELRRLKGDLIERAVHERELLARTRWFVGVMERAPSELAIRLMGRKPAEAKRIVQAYFDDLRRQAAERGGMTLDA